MGADARPLAQRASQAADLRRHSRQAEFCIMLMACFPSVKAGPAAAPEDAGPAPHAGQRILSYPLIIGRREGKCHFMAGGRPGAAAPGSALPGEGTPGLPCFRRRSEQYTIVP